MSDHKPKKKKERIKESAHEVEIGQADSPFIGAVEEYIKDLKYPISKEELLSYIEKNDAPDHVIAMLNDLEAIDYESSEDLFAGLNKARNKALDNPMEIATHHIARNITPYIKGLKYPATKDALLNRAQENNASGETMNILADLDHKKFQNLEEVLHDIKLMQQREAEIRSRVTTLKSSSESSKEINMDILERYLDGSSFPTYKYDLIDIAEQNDAPITFIDHLDQLEERDYESLRDVYTSLKHSKGEEEEEESEVEEESEE